MNNEDKKLQKVGQICKKMKIASTCSKNGIMNLVPTSMSGDTIVQYVRVQKNAVVYETVIPGMDEYEDLWAFSEKVLNTNQKLLFGAFDLDMENNRVSFRSTMYSRDADDITPREVKFHAKMGFSMAFRFLNLISEEDEGKGEVSPSNSRKDAAVAMYQ